MITGHSHSQRQPWGMQGRPPNKKWHKQVYKSIVERSRVEVPQGHELDDRAGMITTSRHPYIYHEVHGYLKNRCSSWCLLLVVIPSCLCTFCTSIPSSFHNIYLTVSMTFYAMQIFIIQMGRSLLVPLSLICCCLYLCLHKCTGKYCLFDIGLNFHEN